MASQKLLAVGKLRNDVEPLVFAGDLSPRSCPGRTNDDSKHKPRNAASRHAQRVPERSILCFSAAGLGVERVERRRQRAFTSVISLLRDCPFEWHHLQNTITGLILKQVVQGKTEHAQEETRILSFNFVIERFFWRPAFCYWHVVSFTITPGRETVCQLVESFPPSPYPPQCCLGRVK